MSFFFFFFLSFSLPAKAKGETPSKKKTSSLLNHRIATLHHCGTALRSEGGFGGAGSAGGTSAAVASTASVEWEEAALPSLSLRRFECGVVVPEPQPLAVEVLRRSLAGSGGRGRRKPVWRCCCCCCGCWALF